MGLFAYFLLLQFLCRVDSSVFLADSSGPPEATPPAVLRRPPGPQEVPVRAYPVAQVLQIKLSLQFEGKRSVLLDLTKCLLDYRPAPLHAWVQTRVQVFGLLDPLFAPPGGRLVADAAITLLPGSLPICEH